MRRRETCVDGLQETLFPLLTWKTPPRHMEDEEGFWVLYKKAAELWQRDWW